MKVYWLSLVVSAALAGFLLTDQTVKISREHNVLTESPPAAALKVGSSVGKLEFKDTAGNPYSLSALLQKGPVAFVFLSVECPVVQRYTVRLNTLYRQFSKQGVTLLGVNSNYNESVEAVANHAKEMGYLFPVIKDSDGTLARRLGATMTPQAFLVDQKGILRYRGAIDDNRYETRIRNHYLQEALISLLKGKPVKIASTETFGCTLHLPERGSLPEKVTYAKHIAPILQEHCQSCHRPGQVAPFSLMTYEEAKAWTKEIKEYTHARLMPPWKPEPGYGEFKNERRLSDEQIALITRWVDSGAPMGDPKDLPPPRKFSDEWTHGQPDLIVEMPEEYEVGPAGEDEYRHFIIPTNLDRDVWVQAIEVQPGNRKTVHHVIVYVDISGAARKLDARDPGPGYHSFGGPGFMPASILGGWAPGFTPAQLPPATGYRLPKGAEIVLQMHYYRTGKPERDRSRVGLYFAKEPNPQTVRISVAINPWFRIPPGAERHEVRASWRAQDDVYLLAITPHMHLLGREMKITAHLPQNGGDKPLVWVKNWDFNWQDTYHYKEPILLPKGTRVEVLAYYDNSEKNPRNPNRPPKEVTWGEKTTDEMCIAFLHYLPASKYNPKVASK